MLTLAFLLALRAYFKRQPMPKWLEERVMRLRSLKIWARLPFKLQ